VQRDDAGTAALDIVRTEEGRRLAEDAADREEMRAIREQMAALAPAPED
jgi:hypothetical protein